eukprot:jgi/Astpho2/4824/Aster-x1261
MDGLENGWVASPPSGALSVSTMRLLWDSVEKPLLRIGRSGIQGSHTSSLRELVQAHSLVKVQLNQQHEVAVAAVAQQLAEASGADVVQVKGRTLLFSDAAVPTPELLAQARQRHDSKRVRRESKATAKQPVTLAPPVQSQLAALHRAGCVPQDAFDNSSLGSYSRLPGIA